MIFTKIGTFAEKLAHVEKHIEVAKYSLVTTVLYNTILLVQCV